MVEKLSVQIELVGGPQVEKELADVTKSFDQATKSIAALGTTGADALNSAAAAAQKFGASAPQLQQVESVIRALAARAKDTNVPFSQLATNYDNARANAGKFAQAANTAGAAIAETGKKVASFRPQLTALSATMAATGVPFGGLVSALSRIGPVGASIAILTVALTGGLAALVKFAAEAAETAKQIDELAGVSGRSFERVSSLANAFSLAGVSTKTFTKDMTALAIKMEEARQQASAEFWGPATEEQKRLANSIGFVAQQWQNVAAGGKAAFSSLTTTETKVKALAKFLDDARKRGDDFELVLADIAKNMTPLERAEILPALGLSPETIAGLKQGRAQIEQLRQEAESLGLTLTTANQQALLAMTQQWNQFTGLLGAFFQKIGALAAPALANILAAFTLAMQQIVADFENLPLDQAVANLGNRLGPAFTALGEVLSPLLSQIGNVLGEALVAGIIAAVRSRLQGPAGGTPLAGGAPIGGPGGGIGSNAAGGLLGGRGTGTSDSNLAWVSRGEYITPASAVRQPGVLALLEALRRSGGNLSQVLNGMGRFALGGMVPRAMPAFASGGLNGGMSNVTIQFPGLPAIGGLRASADVVDQLHKAAALAQVRSGGRKPSRYS